MKEHVLHTVFSQVLQQAAAIGCPESAILAARTIFSKLKGTSDRHRAAQKSPET